VVDVLSNLVERKLKEKRGRKKRRKRGKINRNEQENPPKITIKTKINTKKQCQNTKPTLLCVARIL